mmetsp:Transcript_19116/g.62317  ORF Transcript_19116/g.62317 Transcript_19116/m.62317 type:complete len:194 (+) Transcript_19116:1506-2087(+)
MQKVLRKLSRSFVDLVSLENDSESQSVRFLAGIGPQGHDEDEEQPDDEIPRALASIGLRLPLLRGPDEVIRSDIDFEHFRELSQEYQFARKQAAAPPGVKAADSLMGAEKVLVAIKEASDPMHRMREVIRFVLLYCSSILKPDTSRGYKVDVPSLGEHVIRRKQVEENVNLTYYGIPSLFRWRTGFGSFFSTI